MRYFALFFMLFSNSVLAERLSGKIEGLIPYSSGDHEILIFKLDNNRTGGCNTTERFAIDSSSKKYTATLSSVLAAFHSKTSIVVEYKNSCNYLGNSADVNFICVGSINC
ncbi:hypothetical protein [Bacterioplanoides sp.]|uniref:hypothetical protein n=1 Tax=Bacterioplanoides sp. TaxID=2066072 RepID=UPI003AFFCA14